MLDRDPLEVERATLRDNGSPVRVERIWRRLETNVAAPVPVQRRWSVGWMPALVTGLVAGFLMGNEYSSAPAEATSTLVAEPTTVEAAGPREPLQQREQRRSEQPEPKPEQRQEQLPRVQRSIPLEEPGDGFELGEAPIIETSSSTPVVGAPPAPPQWLRLADRGEYHRAYHGLEEEGGFDLVLQRASPDELMILVDVARATGNRGRAIQALRRVTDSFVSDPNAPIAAMTLGRMLMQAGDRKGASEAFSLYRRLSPEGDFAEDALASDIQAAVEEGNWERAQTLAKQYESDFPDGRHIEQIREQLKSFPQAAGSDSEQEGAASEESPPDAAPVLPPVDSPY